MNKHIQFALTSLWILGSRIYDAYCTYLLTPDLSHEANPLVSVLGLNWPALLLVIGLLTLYVLWAFHQSVFRPENLLPQSAGYTFGNLAAYTYLGERQPWYAVLYRLPIKWSRFHQYMGQVFSLCLVYAGMVSTVMWLLIHHSDAYKHIHSAALIYSILLLGCIVIVYLWNRKQYQLYLRQYPRK
ncbi:hypothetical protein G4D82_05350 [Flavobacterium sp. CYK-4]|uniref:hypothetical protein n=1 Tax=Flavobacterium lotistagni TaxID=2709660 RepID=UPI00140E277F|nr:hypothetical protein [Flavobacterium lotistagni]NHM06638.1 hypothetical protein [Flavobacterium lotistagni]